MRMITVLGLSIGAVTHAGFAFGADLAPARAAPAPVAPILAAPLWTGFHFGGHVGGGESKKKFIDNFPIRDGELDAAPTLKGALGGIQAGYSHQLHGLVVGFEGDLSWADVKDRQFSCFAFGDQVCSAESEWFATLTARVGAAFGPALIYVKGGPAWARDTYTDTATCAGNQPVFRAGIFADCDDTYVGRETRYGWTIGAGIEYRIAPNWSLKAEYNHMDFGSRSVWLVDLDGDKFTEEVHQRADVFKVGFNYFFNPLAVAPVAASPVVSAYAQAGRAESELADTGDDYRPGNVLVFSAIDVARQQFSGWAGGLISLSQDLDTSGPRVMIIGGGGRYKYNTTGVPVRGTYSFGDVLAGYGFEGDNYSFNLMAGLNAVNHMLNREDPTNSVQGTEAGAKVFANLHINPSAVTLYYGETDYSTAFETFSTYHKLGYDFFGTQIFIGPEASYFRDERSNETRVGGHISGMKLGTLQLGVSAGYSDNSIIGTGAYGRLEATHRF
jgi:outer membrane immunogenic protein